MTGRQRPAGGPEQPDSRIPAPTWDPQNVPAEVVVGPAPPPAVPDPGELPDDPEHADP